MRPFRIEIPDAALTELRQKIADTRWPAQYSSGGWERGVPSEYLKGLAEYWSEKYDWRAAESELNRYPQFLTEIDGVTVHFLHIRSEREHAQPLLLTHGWPGSIVEFLDVIGPLTDPAGHGDGSGPAFHLVIPSLPGHGFSGPITEAGWDVGRIADTWAALMAELGYGRYYAGGGDWGSIISLQLAQKDPEHVAGVHISWPTVPSNDAVDLAKMTKEDLDALDQVSMSWFGSQYSGYLQLQTTRPATVSYALSDSPVGLLSWITEKFCEWNTSAQTPEDVVDRDRLLTDVSIYWLTSTIGSTLQLYFESGASLGGLFTPGVPSAPITVPVGVAFFKEDPAPPLRLFGGLETSTLRHWSTLDKGGHFGPMEQPAAFANDLRSFVASVEQ